jgi:hypothetical protein
MKPTDPCAWCGHERKAHRQKREPKPGEPGARVYFASDDGCIFSVGRREIGPLFMSTWVEPTCGCKEFTEAAQ